MASKKKDNNLEDALKGKGQPASLPEGFIAVSALDIDGYFEPQEGAVVRGILIGRFERTKPGPDGKLGHYYQIRLSQMCTAAVEREKDENDEKIPATLMPGQILFMDERKAIEGLKEWADSGRDIEVFVSCGAKIKLDGGKTFWKMNCGARDATPDVIKASFGDSAE